VPGLIAVTAVFDGHRKVLLALDQAGGFCIYEAVTMRWKRFEGRAVAAALALASVVSGCTLYVPESVKMEVSPDGLASAYVKRVTGFVYLTSVSFVPGQEMVNGRGEMRISTCAQGSVKARVEWVDGSVEGDDVATACRLVASSITYIDGFNRESGFATAFEYRAFLSQPGARKEIKKRSIYPITKLAPLFIATWGADSEKNEANLVAVFAHEYVHINAALNGIETDLDYEEETAYLAGACAQLNTNGFVTSKSLPGAPIKKSGDTPNAVVQSSRAAYESRKYLVELMEGDKILLNSKGGEKLNARCEAELAKFFSTTR